MNKEIEFNYIVNDILKCDKFIDLKYEMHHGISRLDHSLSVAHLTYSICKSLNIKKYKDITRAALLHDFFKDSEIEKNSFINHPMQALKNAQANFQINKMQENIIAAHMFPVSVVVPKSVGAWLVTLADKLVALKEVTKYKIPLEIGISYVFLFNFMLIERYINW